MKLSKRRLARRLPLHVLVDTFGDLASSLLEDVDVPSADKKSGKSQGCKSKAPRRHKDTTEGGEEYDDDWLEDSEGACVRVEGC